MPTLMNHLRDAFENQTERIRTAERERIRTAERTREEIAEFRRYMISVQEASRDDTPDPPDNGIEYLVTGTQVYGPATKGSDLDIVVSKDNAQKIKIFLLSKKIKMFSTADMKMYGPDAGFYFDIAGIKINIIATDDYEWWKERTEYMKTIEPVQDKLERNRVFGERNKKKGKEDKEWKNLMISLLTEMEM